MDNVSTSNDKEVIRSGILCPNCFKKKLLQQGEVDAWCDNCLQKFEVVGPNTVRYAGKEVPHS